MPVYVYRNLRTGETFEIEQRITEAALTEHPESGDPVKRLIQPVGIAFKGSGFYVTDSRKGSAPKSTRSSDAGDGKGAATAEAKPGSGDNSQGDKSKGSTAGGSDKSGGGSSD